jgi:hypothetical protein
MVSSPNQPRATRQRWMTLESIRQGIELGLRSGPITRFCFRTRERGWSLAEL